MLLLFVLGCTDYNVKAGQPVLELDLSSLDFGHVVVGTAARATLTLRNAGNAPLYIEDALLDGTTSADFSSLELDRTEIDRGEEAALSVRYAPDAVAMDFGRVELHTNEEARPIVTLDLSGMGVEPEIDLDPDILWFADVLPGERALKSVLITARGSGSLVIDEIALSDGLEGLFDWALPTGVELPYTMPAGVSALLTVGFQPLDEGAVTGELRLSTNDPGARVARVALHGNAGEEPAGASPPTVSISEPDWGDYFLDTESVRITGVAIDAQDPASSLVCLAYAGSSPVGTGIPDAAGAFVITAPSLPVGEITLSVRCLDTSGQLGQDSVDVVVWDPEEPMAYALSGGDTPFDWISVDDDLRVYLDGALVYSDTNHTKDVLPPIALDARVGQTVRVVVTDYNYCDTELATLKLHFGTSRSQAGVDGFCRSACPDHACYDPSYAGPWPSTVYDASFVVSIP